MIATESLNSLRVDYSRLNSIDEESFGAEIDVSSSSWSSQQRLTSVQDDPVRLPAYSGLASTHYEFNASTQARESTGVLSTQTGFSFESQSIRINSDLSAAAPAYQLSSESLQVSNSISAGVPNSGVSLASATSWSLQKANYPQGIAVAKRDFVFSSDIQIESATELIASETAEPAVCGVEEPTFTSAPNVGALILSSSSSNSFSSQVNWPGNWSTTTFHSSQSRSLTSMATGGMTVESLNSQSNQTLEFGGVDSSMNISHQQAITSTTLDIGSSLNMPQAPSLELPQGNGSFASIQSASSLQVDLSFGSQNTFDNTQLADVNQLSTQITNQFQQTYDVGIALV